MTLKIEEVRRWNARALADQAGGITRFAALLDRAQPQMSHIIGTNPSKPIERKQARYIEERCGKPDGWLDIPHPSEWIAIHHRPWVNRLRVDLMAHGISLEASSPVAPGLEAELMTLFATFDHGTKWRMVEIARVMAIEPPPEE